MKNTTSKTAFKVQQDFRGFQIVRYKGGASEAQTYRDNLFDLMQEIPKAIRWMKRGKLRSLSIEAIRQDRARVTLTAIDHATGEMDSPCFKWGAVKHL